MSPPRIALLFAALHALVYLALSIRVVARRRAIRVGIGHGRDEVLARRVRVHGNFAEYVPLALVLLLLLELCGTPAALLWTFGATLLVARLAHAVGLGGSAGVSPGRFAGVVLTFLLLLAMAAVGVVRFASLPSSSVEAPPDMPGMAPRD